MKPVMSTCRWAMSAVLAVTVALATATSAAATSAAPIWGPPVAYGSASSTVTVFLSISCASAGNCVAVGVSEDASDPSGTEPVLAAESGGTWGPVSTVTQLPSEAITYGSATNALKSVSCTSATSCEAVGVYENASKGTDAMVVPITVSGSTATAGAASAVDLPNEAMSPSSSEQLATLDGVSCTSATSCTAVGYYVEKGSSEIQAMIAVPKAGGAWNGAKVTPPSKAESDIMLTSISCPSSGACEAVGNYDEASGDLYPWAVQVTDGAAGTDENVALPSDFKPTLSPPVEPGQFELADDGLSAVSCPSADACTAAGGYTMTSETAAPVAVPITNGTPGTAVKLTSPGAAIGGELESTIDGIWCSDATDCAIAGLTIATTPTTMFEGFVGNETGGTWSSLTPLTPNGDAYGLISSMTCASAGRCVASGYEANEVSGPDVSVTTFFANSVPPLSVATSSLPAASVGVPYSATLQAAGGTGSETWSISPGSLPAGLSLNASTGVISGTPTTSGQSGFIANASDAVPSQTASTGLSIAVTAAATPTPTSTSTSTVGIVYAKTSGKKTTVVLACSVAPCVGKLTITGVEHLKGKKATAVAAKKKKGKASKKVTLSSGKYSVAVGGTQVVTLKLSKTASKLLAQLHKITGNLNVTPTGASKAAIVKKLTFTSKAKAKKKKKK